MQGKRTDACLLGLMALVILAGILSYSHLPARFDSHWNAAGEANGSMPKFWGLAIFPLIMAGLYVLYFIIPRVDPLRANIKEFQRSYDGFWIGVFLFMTGIFALTLVWNFGIRFNFTRAVIPAMAALWYLIGMLMGKLKRNWFMGIRTPWTLSSDLVWERTHALAGMLFKIAAIVSLGAFFFHGATAMIVFLIAPVVLVSILTAGYSFLVYRTLQ